MKHLFRELTIIMKTTQRFLPLFHQVLQVHRWGPNRAALLLACVALAWAAPAATSRDWTGAHSANWSDPNNWSPAGIPTNGDLLTFGNVSDSNRSMVNDVANLVVYGLYFGNNSYVLDGNSLTLTVLDNTESYLGADRSSSPSETVDINCPLVFVVDPYSGIAPSAQTGGAPGRVTQSTLYLHLNGPITTEGNLLLQALSDNSLSGGGNGQLYVSGVVSGKGDVTAYAGDDGSGDVSLVQFDGTPGNTFTGTLYVGTQGSAQINFNKSSGFVATNSIMMVPDLNEDILSANVNFAGPNQLADDTAIIVAAGGMLHLSGNNVTVGSLVLTNYDNDAHASVLDLGSIEVGLNYGLTGWNDNVSVTPVIKGKINLNGVVNCSLGGAAYASLALPATLASLGGLSVNGSKALLLQASNAFTGPIIINSGILDARINGALGLSSGVQLNGGVLTLNSMNVPAKPLTVTAPNSALMANGACTWNGSASLSSPLLAYSFGSMQFNGPISGVGNLELVGETFGIGGSSANTLTGTIIANSTLLTLGKPGTAPVFAGPLTIGNSSGPLCEVRWLGSFQINNTAEAVTLYPGGLMNLNGQNDTIGSLTFLGGTATNFSGATLSLFQSITVISNTEPAVITGGRLALASGLRRFDVEPGLLQPELAIDAEIADVGGIYKTGNGILDLFGPNTFSGGMEVANGVVAVPSVRGLGGGTTTVDAGATLQALNALSSGPVSLAGSGVGGVGGALAMSSGASISASVTLTADATVLVNSGTAYLSGAIGGPGGLTKTGAGVLQLGITDGRTNTYGGLTQVNAGSLSLMKASGTISVPGNLVIGGAHQAATVQNLQSFQLNGVVTVSQGGLWDLNGWADSIPASALQGGPALTLIGGGSVQTGTGLLSLPVGGSVSVSPVGSLSSTATISGNLLLAAGQHEFTVNSGLTFHSSPDLNVLATINSAGTITKDGPGVMRLSANNSLTGVTVSQGELIAGAPSALGGSSNAVLVSGSGKLALDSGVTVSNRPLSLNTTAIPALDSTSGTNVWGGTVTLNQNTGISVEPSSGYLQILNLIGGPGGLTKLGPGVLEFLGSTSNSYAGHTTVSNGVLAAGRVSMVSIPGDADIGDDSTTNVTATLRLLRDQPIWPNANVAVHSSGLLEFYQLTNTPNVVQQLRTLTGHGQVSLGVDGVLEINNDVPFEFYGPVYGGGQISKQGAGVMTTWGVWSNTGNSALLEGEWRLNGQKLHSLDVEGGATLRGGGYVEQVVMFGGTSLAVDSLISHQQGGTFQIGTLTPISGPTVELNMYGPSPNGGNDRLVLGAGGISQCTLQTSFGYPPREGDVITLVTLTNSSTMGNFNNFPPGLVAFVDQIPVLPSYTGGDGNDFTLTVTDLALAYGGYRLAEGNGNQTVEPNECNLLYISLINQRTNPVAITSAYLRATNATGVLVTIPYAAYSVIGPGQSAENLVPFQFRTDSNLPCGGTVGFELVLSVVNEGEFAVGFNPASGNNCNQPTGPCLSCTTTSGQFTSNSPAVQVPLYFVGAPSLCLPNKPYPGTNPVPAISPAAYLTHGFTNSTTNQLCVSAQLDFDCPAAPTNALGVAAYLGRFDTNNPGNGYLGDIGIGGPPYPAFSFQVPPMTNFTLVVMALTTNLSCNNYSLELFGLPCPPPTLAIAKEESTPSSVRLLWSTAYPGFVAQQSGQPGSPFSDLNQTPAILNSHYALTNLLANTNQFFRLRN